ncbi:ASST-domain-containing protein [Microdochium bolleyi]|uniref:ASST-domain-containing protein n=1 Tax=Microdochium bolleyi TaxID=196109 RepID=A0A136JCZ6_9PEZI|nr:ASST-domain-containing protein [Microdochium bolleyi]
MRSPAPWIVGLVASTGVTSAAVVSPPRSHAFYNDFGYEKLAYGMHPFQAHRTLSTDVPKFNILQSSPQCSTNLYTFLAPRGKEVQVPQATIFDSEGRLVWTSGYERQQLYDLKVQAYKGEQYLTFWSGDDTVGGHGAGTIHMLDKNYQEFKKIQAANGKDADLHDFVITKDGTALITIYARRDVDLNSVGKPFAGPVWDCYIQEINIETGEAIFEWSALDHLKISSAMIEIGPAGEDDIPWDWFHINSIDKDAKGNYLVSSRFLQALVYIDGRSGDVIWIIGGKDNMFTDLSGGNATNFAYQHDARWADDDTTITMFDNAVDDYHLERALTRGLKIRVDQTAMTAQIVTEYMNPRKIIGKSQGSYQTLPNGHVLLGYGDSAAFTEYAADGTVLCDVHFGPEVRYTFSDVMSYRVHKYEWHGWPLTLPVSVLDQSEDREWKVYVSWNGATEIKDWVLEGANELTFVNKSGQMYESTSWKKLTSETKIDYETAIALQYHYPAWLRVVALDAAGNVLGVGESLNGTAVGQPWRRNRPPIGEEQDWMMRVLVYFCGALSLCMAGYMLKSIWRSSGGHSHLRRRMLSLRRSQAWI